MQEEREAGRDPDERLIQLFRTVARRGVRRRPSGIAAPARLRRDERRGPACARAREPRPRLIAIELTARRSRSRSTTSSRTGTSGAGPGSRPTSRAAAALVGLARAAGLGPRGPRAPTRRPRPGDPKPGLGRRGCRSSPRSRRPRSPCRAPARLLADEKIIGTGRAGGRVRDVRAHPARDRARRGDHLPRASCSGSASGGAPVARRGGELVDRGSGSGTCTRRSARSPGAAAAVLVGDRAAPGGRGNGRGGRGHRRGRCGARRPAAALGQRRGAGDRARGAQHGRVRRASGSPPRRPAPERASVTWLFRGLSRVFLPVGRMPVRRAPRSSPDVPWMSVAVEARSGLRSALRW